MYAAHRPDVTAPPEPGKAGGPEAPTSTRPRGTRRACGSWACAMSRTGRSAGATGTAAPGSPRSSSRRANRPERAGSRLATAPEAAGVRPPPPHLAHLSRHVPPNTPDRRASSRRAGATRRGPCPRAKRSPSRRSSERRPIRSSYTTRAAAAAPRRWPAPASWPAPPPTPPPVLPRSVPAGPPRAPAPRWPREAPAPLRQ